MRIRCFKEIPFSEGIIGYEACQVDLPLAQIFDEHISEVDFIQEPGNQYVTIIPDEGYTRRRYRRRHYRPATPFLSIKLPHLTIKQGHKEISFCGFLTYRSPYDLISFLIEYYCPQGTTEVDNLLRDKTNHSNGKIAQKLYYILFNNPRQDYFPCTMDGTFPVFPAIDENQIREIRVLKRLEIKGQWFHFESTKYHDDEETIQIIFVEHYQPCKDTTVPVRHFLLSGKKSKNCLFWNGSQLTRFNLQKKDWQELVSYLPADFVNELEKSGNVVSVLNGIFFDPLPRFDSAVRLILRVPAWHEVEDRLEPDKLKRLKMPVEAGKPLFFADSRSAVTIPDNPLVVSNPDDALYILSRLKDGVYIPGDFINAPQMEYQPHYLCGMELI